MRETVTIFGLAQAMDRLIDSVHEFRTQSAE